MKTKEKTNNEYLQVVERAAHNVVEAACEEDSFEVFIDEGDKTALQQAITELACNLRFIHHEEDGCIDHE
jgi:hypothetical protein